MKATNHTNDYFRVVDLNPATAAGVPAVNDPRDPRGQCYFGFVSQGQRLVMEFGTNPPPVGLRVLYTWDYDYFPGAGLPVPTSVKPHGQLQMAGGGPFSMEQMHEEHHDRTFVALWIDPNGTQPVVGQTVQILVKAWRED